MANAATTQQDVSIYHEVNGGEMVRTGLAGLAAGILIPLAGFLLSQFVINPVFCQGAAAGGICDTSNLVGYYVAAVLVTAAAIPLLVSWGIFRALLIAIGSALALWGLQKYIEPLVGASWLEYYAYSAFLYAAAYLLFYWVMRLRNFGFSLGLSVVVVLLVRWALLT